MGKKSKRLGAALPGKGGAGVRRVTRCPLPGAGGSAHDCTIQFSRRGKAWENTVRGARPLIPAGHSLGTRPRWQIPGRGSGAPLVLHARAVLSPACPLSPTLPCPPKGTRGLAARRVRWERRRGRRAGGKARARLVGER